MTASPPTGWAAAAARSSAFAFQYEGNSGEAAALSTLPILAVSLLALLFERLGRKAPGIVPWRD